MKTYHMVWLRAHPDRTEAWLRERLLDGFDVHHSDGDHSNNDPDNLVLIEAVDHMRLHGLGTNIAARLKGGKRGRPKHTHGPNGAVCYEARSSGLSWSDVGSPLGITKRGALVAARNHAMRYGLPWPIELPHGEIKPVAPGRLKPQPVGNDPYAGILPRFRNLPLEKAKRAQWFHDTTIR